jgi:Gpi18-like mannosyltransferase
MTGRRRPSVPCPARAADRTLADRPQQLVLLFAGFLVFLIPTLSIWRARSAASRRWTLLIILAGLLFRVAVAPARGPASSDMYRYLWEGRVVRAGMNPYAHSPRSPELAPLHDWVWGLVQHKSVPAAYPPVAQYVFALAGLLPLNPVIELKLVLALFDALTVLLLADLIRRLGRPAAWVICYAWHPLAVCEVVGRGHLDSVGIFFLVLSVRLLLVRSGPGRVAAGASLALSVLSKGYALVAVPFLALAAKPHRRHFLLALLLVGFLAYVPFLSAGTDLFRGLTLYAQKWTGNSSVFALVDLAFSRLTLHHDAIARVVCGIALAAWLAWLIFTRPRSYNTRDAIRLSLQALMGFFLLTPAVYPWYLAWTLPFLCLQRSLAWLVLTGTIFGFYAHDFAGHHNEIWWVTLGEYGVPLLIWLAASVRRRDPGAATEAACE